MRNSVSNGCACTKYGSSSKKMTQETECLDLSSNIERMMEMTTEKNRLTIVEKPGG